MSNTDLIVIVLSSISILISTYSIMKRVRENGLSWLTTVLIGALILATPVLLMLVALWIKGR